MKVGGRKKGKKPRFTVVKTRVILVVVGKVGRGGK
jgi:hypothetical protein